MRNMKHIIVPGRRITIRDSVASLTNDPPRGSLVVLVLGATTPNDGGGGWYVRDPTTKKFVAMKFSA